MQSPREEGGERPRNATRVKRDRLLLSEWVKPSEAVGHWASDLPSSGLLYLRARNCWVAGGNNPCKGFIDGRQNFLKAVLLSLLWSVYSWSHRSSPHKLPPRELIAQHCFCVSVICRCVSCPHWAYHPQANLLGLNFPLLPAVTLENTIDPPEAMSSALWPGFWTVRCLSRGHHLIEKEAKCQEHVSGSSVYMNSPGDMPVKIESGGKGLRPR